MKRFLALFALACAVFVPAATAAPAATHTLRGTVVAKDRPHRALVVALPGGTVRTLVAPRAFTTTDIGRKVTVRFSPVAGHLPLALGVSVTGWAQHAVVRGTIIRLAHRHAVVNAGGSAFTVMLRGSTASRQLAAAHSGPQVGDTVKIDVDIAKNGALGGAVTVITPAAQAAAEGEMEVRGKVKGPLSPTSLTIATGSGVEIMCGIPTGVTVSVAVGDLVEMQCELVNGAWVIKVANNEDDQGDDDQGDNGSNVDVQGVITSTLDAKSTAVTVTPVGGTPVTCAITPGSLSDFTVGDAVEMSCIKVGDVLTLDEIDQADDQGESGDDSNDD